MTIPIDIRMTGVEEEDSNSNSSSTIRDNFEWIGEPVPEVTYSRDRIFIPSKALIY